MRSVLRLKNLVQPGLDALLSVGVPSLFPRQESEARISTVQGFCDLTGDLKNDVASRKERGACACPLARVVPACVGDGHP
jgi:hypothetical protein